MDDTLTFHTLDVFTDRAFAGNPLAVVLGADGLTEAQMLTLAREFNLSETIFVQRPADPAHDARVRIFFPTAEIPFAGHPTIGCAIHLATARHDGDFDCVITLEEEAGLVPVTVTRKEGVTRAEFVAPILPLRSQPAPDLPLDLLAAAVDLSPDLIGPHAPGVFEGGPRFLYIPVRDVMALSQARPIEPFWSQAIAAAGVDSAYLYAPGQDCDWRVRMFSPTAGIPEDPATGSASAILAAQLLAHGALPDGETVLTLQQGIEMGRPSQIGLTTVVAGDALHQVRIAGQAVPIASGQIRRP